MNEPLGRLGSFKPALVRLIAVGHCFQGVVLADDPLVELLFHAKQLGGLFFCQLGDGDTRPVPENLGDNFLVHEVEKLDALGCQLLLLVTAKRWRSSPPFSRQLDRHEARLLSGERLIFLTLAISPSVA